MKKYKLVIPEMIERKYARIAEVLEKHEGEIFNEKVSNAVGLFHFGYYIPWEWLEEVEDRPMTADEYVEKIVKTDRSPFFILDVKNAFNAGMEETKKGFKPNISFLDAWRDEEPIGSVINKYWFLRGWQAHAKATGTEA